MAPTMTDSRSVLYVSFPESGGELLHWWHVRDDAQVANGCDRDPLSAVEVYPDNEEFPDLLCIALLRSASCTLRWHITATDINDRQALSAALIEARGQSLSGDQLHVAGQVVDDTTVLTASVDREILSQGLLVLQERGLDPDIIVPAASYFDPDPDTVWSVDLGFDRFLRGNQIASPDEQSLRSAIAGDKKLEDLDQRQAGQALAAATERPVPNLRSGPFAKKVRSALGPGQKKMLISAVAALIIISLLIPLIQLVRLHLATNDANENALVLAEPVAGEVDDPEQAERLLDEKLAASNLGNAVFSVPTAALFSAIQQTPGVSISRISYQDGGVVAAELTAVQNEDMNPALLAIQAAGFKITATPRSDASGMAKADITVRAP